MIFLCLQQVSKDGENYLNSFLIFFSYPNGTDFYMNISPYVKNSEFYVTNNNLISYLHLLDCKYQVFFDHGNKEKTQFLYSEEYGKYRMTDGYTINGARQISYCIRL